MAKVSTVYVCQECGAEHSKWQGQCSQCEKWNTLVEEVRDTSSKGSKSSRSSKRGGSGGRVVTYGEVSKAKKRSDERLTSGSEELNRVLGGGMVPGSVILVGGEPGIGKSTLLTQLAMQVGGENSTFQISDNKQASNSKSQKSKRGSDISAEQVLYVCGEESVEQVVLRVERLSATLNSSPKAQNDNLLLLATNNVDQVVVRVEDKKPGIVIVDSIQTMQTEDLTGMAGSVGQVRESAFRLIEAAKKTGAVVYLVGHVTKEGAIAGPKVLEHMVDTVLTLEGERTGMWRLLRSYKNRFGPTDEVGVFELTEKGMKDVANPSGAFLEEAQQGEPGSVTVAVMEGTRPVLVEIQALTVKSQLAVPRRVAHGVAVKRVQLLAAVLQKKSGLRLSEQDIFVNVAGGLTLKEPAADLGIALAIASSVKNKALPKKSVVVGEVGLLGEIRRVAYLERRLKEADKLGYGKGITPKESQSLKQVVKRYLG